MSTGFITLPAHRYDRVTRPMALDIRLTTGVSISADEASISDDRHTLQLEGAETTAIGLHLVESIQARE